MASPTAAAFVAQAKSMVGVPYVWGGAGPGGVDCSGLVQYSLIKIGLSGVPRTSEQQWAWCHHITQADLQAGDLIFEQWPGDNSPPGHVIIFIGGGQVVEAPQPGQSVHIRSWSPSETTIVGYGAIPGLSGAGGDFAGVSGGDGADPVAAGIIQALTEMP